MNSEIKTNYVQHFSTRIPWKDNDYTGRVDDNPRFNMAAQIIPNIATARDFDFEEENKGRYYKDLEPYCMQHWITENAAFMSEETIDLFLVHIYSKDDKNIKFQHLKDTIFQLEPYSFLMRPFSWLLKDNAKERSNYYNFYFDYEKNERMLDFSANWVSHGKSQKGIFDYFYSGIEPQKSLIFPYYKQVPFIEDSKRVIAGIGNIASKVNYHEYRSDGSSEDKHYIWETNLAHTIRNDGEEGFLMPYIELSEYAEKHPDFNIENVTLFGPTGFIEEFSYGAEWVSYDAAIDVLNQAKVVLKNISELGLERANPRWANKQLDYIDLQLENVWNQRGIFPGLGSALSAFGVKYGFDIAKYIDTSDHNLITELQLFFTREKLIGIEKLDDSLAENKYNFSGLLKNKDKTKYFELLSRINLSFDQAKNAWEKFKDNANDIISNPYLLYELTRKEEEKNQITISQIDNAMFVNPYVDNKHPVEEPMKMITESDERRFRALVMFVLENAIDRGHTLLRYNDVIEEIEKLPLDCKTSFNTEMIDGLVDYLKEGELYIDEEIKYIKLGEYQEYKEVARGVLSERLSDRLPNAQNWKETVANSLKEIIEDEKINDDAINEQAEALEILETSKISVLTGGAGTGKTTALGVFASSEEIQKGGVLALAPTGKARVQLENSFRDNGVEADFMTVAQFLNLYGGFDGRTMEYCMPTEQSQSTAKTVIIDESSMLTESMFAGILKLVNSKALRIIFVGDPNQLPPIGAGRPFVDLVKYLEKTKYKRVARLKTVVRQEREGDDLLFAQLFSDIEYVDKDIIYRIENNKTDNRLRFIQYADSDELEKVFFDELRGILGTNVENETDDFNKSLGATVDKYTSFNTSEHIENWQILSPTKYRGIGSGYLNNQIQQRYRKEYIDRINNNPWSKDNPNYIRNIVYGDKIISNENGERPYYDGQRGKAYIANGEMGIMVFYPNLFKRNKGKQLFYNFFFSSYDQKSFSYKKKELCNEKRDSKLELAYALTVHKSQGSTFGDTIVVINGKSPLITKELLYTAFSRQKDKLVILSDLSIFELAQYARDNYSDTKKRFTDLFITPDIQEIEYDEQKGYYEEYLIHRTLNNEMVRSKSEVIVANILKDMDIEYRYEEPLNVNGTNYLPDFTLYYQGKKAYLEHLGILGDESYKRRWEKKKAEYESDGISEDQGNLITTWDELDGSIDSQLIEDRIKECISKL